jgi:hypothetical protein
MSNGSNPHSITQSKLVDPSASRVLGAATDNASALCWNTSFGGLQTGAIKALGRIFDHRSPHNLNALVRLVSQHRTNG